MDAESRAQFAGYLPGAYVRLVLPNVPVQTLRHFDPRYPFIVGGLQATEEQFGFVHVRLKKHRWHKKILKSKDPLTLSVGWRRYQTVALYYVEGYSGLTNRSDDQ